MRYVIRLKLSLVLYNYVRTYINSNVCWLVRLFRVFGCEKRITVYVGVCACVCESVYPAPVKTLPKRPKHTLKIIGWIRVIMIIIIWCSHFLDDPMQILSI